MSCPEPILVFSPHPDDWPIFAGPAVYAHLRDPSVRVCVVDITAGDAGDDDRYWKARHSGAVTALLRGQPAWSPYALGDGPAPVLPASFGVAYARTVCGGKTLLRTRVTCGERDVADLISLHLPDGRADGIGFAPSHQSLAGLRDGRCTLQSLWPEEEPVTYATWGELLATLREAVEEYCAGYSGTIRLYAPDPDPQANPDDHSDHLMTGLAARELCAHDARFRPIWMSTYANGARPENLAERDGAVQRAAIVAYGCGYAATVAETGKDWRRGWERELDAFKNRQYLRRDEP
jgi:hypothetical protein